MSMKLSPRDLQMIQSDIEICNILINVIDALCWEIPELRNSYILSEHKEELQYLVKTKNQQIKLDSNANK